MDQGKVILCAEGVGKRYRVGKRMIDVLRGASVSLQQGEWLAILGASGSGKTTFLNILGALERPDSGRVRFGDIFYDELSASRAALFRRQRIGFVFQAYHMLPELSVLENVCLPALLDGQLNRKSRFRASELLERVGLGHRLEHKPMELSGGEQQRAAIARSLINNPDLILADEPTGNLDSKTGGEILEIFRELHDSDSGHTFVMVTHDHEVAAQADRRIQIQDGKTETESIS